MVQKTLFFFFIASVLNVSHGDSRGLPDMFGLDREVEMFEPPHKSVDRRMVAKCPGPDKRGSPCDMYYKRFLNVLLQRTELRDIHLKSDDSVMVPVKLAFSGKTLQIIKSFALKESHEYTWNDLDEALSFMFDDILTMKTKMLEDKDEEIETNFAINPSSWRPEVVIVGVIGTIILLSFWFILKGTSPLKTLVLMFIITFSFGLGLTWWKAIEEERIDAIVKLMEFNSIPQICNPAMQTWWERNFSLKGTCKEYHWAQVNPTAKVAFTDIFVRTITNMFATPLPIIGDALGSMSQKYSKHLPWYVGIIFWAIQLIVTPIFFGMLVMMVIFGLFGYSLHLTSLFGSFNLSRKAESGIEGSYNQHKIENQKREIQDLIDAKMKLKKRAIKYIGQKAEEKKIKPQKEIKYAEKGLQSESADFNSDSKDYETPSENSERERGNEFTFIDRDEFSSYEESDSSDIEVIPGNDERVGSVRRNCKEKRCKKKKK